MLSCVDCTFGASVDRGDIDRCGMRSCVRPVCAVRLTADPDEVRARITSGELLK